MVPPNPLFNGQRGSAPSIKRLELEADSFCQSGQEREEIYLPHVSCAGTTFKTLSVFVESNLMFIGPCIIVITEE